MREWAKVIFALPIVQLRNFFGYARMQEGLATKIGTFWLFIPLLLLSTVIWLMAWALAIFTVIQAVTFLVGKALH